MDLARLQRWVNRAIIWWAVVGRACKFDRYLGVVLRRLGPGSIDRTLFN
jgi:hypothetical protein